MEYLYVTIGNHAKNNGIKIDLNFTRSSSGDEKYYNINFTATGTYVRIAEFIMNLEDDSSLGFKIEEFSMTGESNTIQATFVCKDVKIQGISSNSSTSSSRTQTNTIEDGTTSNTTNNTTTGNTNTARNTTANNVAE